MKYTYVTDLPNQTAAENMRQGIRLRRQLLLPNALRANPHFVALLDATDETLDEAEHLAFGLQNLRNPWVTNPALENSITSGEMLEETDWTEFDENITLQQSKLIGFLPHKSSPRLLRHLPKFWAERRNGIDLLNFCFGLNLELVKLWTSDYINFCDTKQTDEHYLTTHVRVRTPAGTLNKEALELLIYQVVPYTTVIHEIEEY